MNDLFKVYAQTRATRQLAGDVYNKLEYGTELYKLLYSIESQLNDIECKLERIPMSNEDYYKLTEGRGK